MCEASIHEYSSLHLNGVCMQVLNLHREKHIILASSFFLRCTCTHAHKLINEHKFLLSSILFRIVVDLTRTFAFWEERSEDDIRGGRASSTASQGELWRIGHFVGSATRQEEMVSVHAHRQRSQFGHENGKSEQTAPATI